MTVSVSKELEELIVRIDRKRVRKVLVIGLSCLGDMLLTTAALWNLRLYLGEDAHFTLWVPPRAIPAVEGDPLWDLVEPYDRGGKYSGFMGRIRAIQKIRQGRYDLILDLRATLLPLFSGARYAPLWGLREAFLPKSIHEAERNLYVIGKLGVPLVQRNLRFFISDEVQNYIFENYPQLRNREREAPFIVFNPGGNSGYPSKCWPVKFFAELGNTLVKRYNALIGVIGYSSAEEKSAKEILSKLPEKSRLDLAGKQTGFQRLSAILGSADLFVTNDTGTIHLASAVGVPTVGLYGPSRPERYGPWGNRHRIVISELPCAPCRGKVCISGIEDCMSHISVNRVFSSCQELLQDFYKT